MPSLNFDQTIRARRARRRMPQETQPATTAPRDRGESIGMMEPLLIGSVARTHVWSRSDARTACRPGPTQLAR
jgi:hypothetical protein